MGANIPFEPDQLRYGGDKRETDDAFWIDLLNEFECNYRTITDSAYPLRLSLASMDVEYLLDNTYGTIENFVRE
jgi:hypothetical protein